MRAGAPARQKRGVTAESWEPRWREAASSGARQETRESSPAVGGEPGTAEPPRKEELKSDESFAHLPNKRDMCKDVSHGVERTPEKIQE